MNYLQHEDALSLYLKLFNQTSSLALFKIQCLQLAAKSEASFRRSLTSPRHLGWWPEVG